MDIVKNEHYVSFSKINEGVCFYYRDDLYMRIVADEDEIVRYNAIDLGSNRLEVIEDDYQVIPVNAKIVID